MDKRFFDHMLTVNNGRRSQLSSKVSDELFEKEYGESQKTFVNIYLRYVEKNKHLWKKYFLFCFHFICCWFVYCNLCFAVFYSHKQELKNDSHVIVAIDC